MRPKGIKRHPNHDKAVAYLLEQPLDELHRQYKDLQDNLSALHSDGILIVGLNEYRKIKSALYALEEAIRVYGQQVSQKVEVVTRCPLCGGPESSGCGTRRVRGRLSLVYCRPGS